MQTLSVILVLVSLMANRIQQAATAVSVPAATAPKATAPSSPNDKTQQDFSQVYFSLVKAQKDIINQLKRQKADGTESLKDTLRNYYCMLSIRTLVDLFLSLDQLSGQLLNQGMWTKANREEAMRTKSVCDGLSRSKKSTIVPILNEIVEQLDHLSELVKNIFKGRPQSAEPGKLITLKFNVSPRDFERDSVASPLFLPFG